MCMRQGGFRIFGGGVRGFGGFVCGGLVTRIEFLEQVFFLKSMVVDRKKSRIP